MLRLVGIDIGRAWLAESSSSRLSPNRASKDDGMRLSLAKTQAINELAGKLYSFLPGIAHPFAHPAVSFGGIAASLQLGDFWSGGSKQPAIVGLLSGTLQYKQGKFCTLITEIVRRGISYRQGKSMSISRQEIQEVNELITRIGFKIPELLDAAFLDSLPSVGEETEKNLGQENQRDRKELAADLIQIGKLEGLPRGFAFERFLKRLFAFSKLNPRSSFRLTGEQIDGSLELDADVYLIEARWRKEVAGNADLLVLHGKVESKSSWSRGLFISYSGFSIDGLEAFSRGRSTTIIGMTGEDLHFVLEGSISLDDLIRRKARRAAETGQVYVSAYELSLGI